MSLWAEYRLTLRVMSNLGSQGGSNREAPEVSSRYVASLDDIAVHIRLVRESALPLFSVTIGSIFVEDWTRVMSQNFRAIFVPKNIKVMIACMFLKEEPATWFERAVQAHLYTGDKFRSSLERNFGSFGADWDRRMIKEFGNSTDDSSEGGFGRYESIGPSNVPGRDIGDDSSGDGDNKEDLEEKSNGTEAQEKGFVRKG